MAKKQSRRGVSLSRSTYDAVMRAADEEGISGSEWVTRLVRERIGYLPEQVHVRPASEGEPSHAVGRPRVVLHVPNATHEPPKSVIAAPRREPDVPPGTICANCVEKPATHRGRIDTSGAVYNLCNGCELPQDNVEDGRGRWKRRTA